VIRIKFQDARIIVVVLVVVVGNLVDVVGTE
jgi:hypothetical protein